MKLFFLMPTLVFSVLLSASRGFVPKAEVQFRLDASIVRPLSLSNDENLTGERRDFFATSAAAIGSSLLLMASTSVPAIAAADPQIEKDKENIVKGYKRLEYLLSNWEKETTECKIGGDSLEKRCERNPYKVMEYIGYKSTTDPLFRADKTLMRLYTLVDGGDSAIDFIEAVEKFNENADEANGMAFVSSWGEANPGGGKDRVELFIERAKKNVIVARDSLKTVISILDLKV